MSIAAKTTNVYLKIKIPFIQKSYHAIQLICVANQLTIFYMIIYLTERYIWINFKYFKFTETLYDLQSCNNVVLLF